MRKLYVVEITASGGSQFQVIKKHRRLYYYNNPSVEYIKPTNCKHFEITTEPYKLVDLMDLSKSFRK